jgi:hypothetical protein
MHAPTQAPTTSSADQYYAMGGATAGGHGTGCNCGSHQSAGATSASRQARQPGLHSSATVSGASVSERVAHAFAPGTLDRQDAVLLWTGVNSVLFAALVYLEVRG